MKMTMKSKSKSKSKESNGTNLLRPIIHMYGSPSTSLLLLLLLLLAPITRSQPANSTASPAPSRHEASRRFTPSIVVVIVILIAAFFLMAFISFYLRLRAGDIRSRPSLFRSLTGSRREPRRGLEPAAIDSLPCFDYSEVKGLKLGGVALECAVCLNEFEDGETLRLLPRCSHVFHPDCIGSWLLSRATCPVCRADLVAADTTGAKDPAVESPAPAATEDEASDEVPLHHVAVDVCEDRNGRMPIPNQDCPIRSKSTRQGLKFPRSHTTGHSLVLPGENLERFTLRLPEHVRKEIFDGRLDRSASHAAFRTGGRSRSGGIGVGRFQWRFDRAAKSDRWGFLARAISVRSQKRGDGEQTVTQNGVLPSVKTSCDCLGRNGEATARPDPVRSSSPVFSVSTE